jgi:serine/threonine-protein kinase
VVAAVHVVSGTRVAIKYLSPRLLAAPGFLEAFRSEAALLQTINVPQVVRIFGYAEATGRGAAIVMELVDGVSLHEMITRQGPASPESALLVLKGSLLGLAAAHAREPIIRPSRP